MSGPEIGVWCEEAPDIEFWGQISVFEWSGLRAPPIWTSPEVALSKIHHRGSLTLLIPQVCFLLSLELISSSSLKY
jgi:hypothetical protein